MAEQTIDHWQALFDHNYLRWFNLNGAASLVEIVAVEGLVEMTLPGGAKTRKPVVHLKQLQGKIENAVDDNGKTLPTIKPLVLNSTNAGTIAEIHGKKPSAWVGGKIVLYPSTTKMWSKESKKMVEMECIRIRAPKE